MYDRSARISEQGKESQTIEKMQQVFHYITLLNTAITNHWEYVLREAHATGFAPRDVIGIIDFRSEPIYFFPAGGGTQHIRFLNQFSHRFYSSRSFRISSP